MEFLLIVIAFIALFTALSARKGVQSLQPRLDDYLGRIGRLEAEIELLRAGRPGEAGAPPPGSATAAPEPEAVPAPQPAPAPEPQTQPEAGAVPSVPAAAPAAITLEERLGTRWAVWVGGLALALGGLLLVRYSIEQGIFGPGVRIALGALFSLALVAAGEWFRRTERAPPIQQIPAAHVPSILTAAGTASAFGTVYAAHALYGFIGPAAAFVLLGIIGIATMLAAALHGPALAGLGLAGSLVVPLLVSSDSPSPW